MPAPTATVSIQKCVFRDQEVEITATIEKVTLTRTVRREPKTEATWKKLADFRGFFGPDGTPRMPITLPWAVVPPEIRGLLDIP